MKASELINHLNKLITKHGDLEVMKPDEEFGGHYSISKPKMCNSEKPFTFDNGKEKFVSKKIFEV